MTRRTHACLVCAGMPVGKFSGPRRTRHRDRVCSSCRRRGVRVEDGVLKIPFSLPVNYLGRHG